MNAEPRNVTATRALLLLLLLLVGCGGSDAPTTTRPPAPVQPTEPTIEPPVTAEYRVRPPSGKLPWPHHDPSWSQPRYEAMLDSIWVINNYALYQGSADRATLYLHSGIDVVLPNGTQIFAVEAGTVRSIAGGDPYYQTMIVEDVDEPGHGWGYTHVYGFRVQPGDRVEQGTTLAVVNFLGVEHIHLSRLHLRAGGSWSDAADVLNSQPDSFFVFRDTEPPVFEGRFRYLRAGTDSAFTAPAEDQPVTVAGDVDLVVGLRDPGEWTRSKVPFGGSGSYGDRHAPNRVEVEIAGATSPPLRFVAFDLSRLYLPRGSAAENAATTLALYQHYEAVTPPAPPVGNYDRKFNYYIVTNTPGTEAPGELGPARAIHAWRTPETADGDYTVTIRAFDSSGNVAERSERVQVANGR